ncbi:hypothetical protein ACJIZ3_005982 [Penstemon smallii]|uniref:Uncharacterized protein n=1 Tax=Penstemon smallii TaxID=265156 RepID=A0ABD3S6K0_9LAMI
MSSVYGVEPKLDHYYCMVDLFGHSSCLKENLLTEKLFFLNPYDQRKYITGVCGCPRDRAKTLSNEFSPNSKNYQKPIKKLTLKLFKPIKH